MRVGDHERPVERQRARRRPVAAAPASHRRSSTRTGRSTDRRRTDTTSRCRASSTRRTWPRRAARTRSRARPASPRVRAPRYREAHVLDRREHARRLMVDARARGRYPASTTRANSAEGVGRAAPPPARRSRRSPLRGPVVHDDGPAVERGVRATGRGGGSPRSTIPHARLPRCGRLRRATRARRARQGSKDRATIGALAPHCDDAHLPDHQRDAGRALTEQQRARRGRKPPPARARPVRRERRRSLPPCRAMSRQRAVQPSVAPRYRARSPATWCQPPSSNHRRELVTLTRARAVAVASGRELQPQPRALFASSSR